MRLNNFKDNISLIEENDRAFHSFLEQVITKKHSQPKNSENNYRQSVQQSLKQRDCLKENMSRSQIINPQNQVTSYQEVSKPIHSQFYCSKNKDTFQSSNLTQDNIVIRNLNKLNPNLNKSFQQEKIKKQQSSEIIELKSVKELPSWLFQHIRKNHKAQLKNKYAKEDHQNTMKSLRYKPVKHFNESNQMNVSSMQIINDQNDRVFLKTYKPQQISSSLQIRKSHKNFLSKEKKMRKVHDFVMSEFQHPYCPQNEYDSKKLKANFLQKTSGMESSENYQKKRCKNYRIRDREDLKKKKDLPIMSKNRLVTVSEQDPLLSFRKN